MADLEFVEISTVNPRILIDMRYATANNFMGRPLYRSAKCYLRKNVAFKLDAIQKKLEAQGLGLKVFDAYRPLSVQKIFWEFLPDDRYVADPAVGSKHNRGAAVDVTLVDHKGCELRMPTPFDDFTTKAHRDCTQLPPVTIENRLLLEKIMLLGGFIPLPTEWWHFDDADWMLYPVEDIPIEQLCV
jgi:D-alanyl-D-alanine dipeptidase